MSGDIDEMEGNGDVEGLIKALRDYAKVYRVKA